MLDRLRAGCAEVAERARHVAIDHAAIGLYAASLPERPRRASSPEAHPEGTDRETLAAFWLTLDAINFGSGWFPTLRKRRGGSGYLTVSTGLRERFEREGPWSAAELAQIEPPEVAQALGQDSDHELMALFSDSLRDLGRHIERECRSRFSVAVDSARGSAPALVRELAAWDCFADTSRYGAIELPFLKRAQIAAADLDRAGVARLHGLERLTLFADNLVPHVLRLDGILRFDSSLVAKIERGELIAHDSPEEVEIRACALHAVELIVAARAQSAPMTAAAVDQVLWLRGQGRRYKASPRHRARCTAY